MASPPCGESSGQVTSRPSFMRPSLVMALLLVWVTFPGSAQQRVRARALGIAPGTLPTGVSNSITDVAGVRVGQTTVMAGDSVRTGVTAILPHPGNLFFERVP